MTTPRTTEGSIRALPRFSPGHAADIEPAEPGSRGAGGGILDRLKQH
ncbi:hypothetical protein ACVDG3_17930 [Meridianimarinicoccus sp. RP-17]|nr:hypothetical protein [Phycocomes zhengii]